MTAALTVYDSPMYRVSRAERLRYQQRELRKRLNEVGREIELVIREEGQMEQEYGPRVKPCSRP